MQADKQRIPVTIITGFLGAGKTTLLNRFIREYPDKQYAIIENEFGEIGIDSEIVVNIDNSNICELTNGCICCTLNENLADLLKDLLNSGKPFNHLLIETTGIADPATVIQTFFSDAEVKSSFKMDSVICLADALHYISTAKEQEEVHRQIAVSDLVLLNKANDQESGTLEEVRKSICSINPHCEIYETNYADIGELNLLDRYTYQADRVQSFTLDAFRALAVNEPASGYLEKNKTSRHQISSYGFSLPGAFDLEKFSFWIEYFLYLNQLTIFRTKGILNFEGNPQRMILQSVRSSYTLDDGDYWDVEEERENKIVFIGKNLDYQEISKALENLMV